MGALLGHMDLMPLIYGFIMFLGIWSMYHKLMSGQLFGFVVEAGIFSLVFWLHGGSMNGGFAAMIAALIAGQVLPRMRHK
ncbi:MAG: hypothetical protein QFB87_05075 [Patescibacteria group bacterium]|nr:hypothetical protein [Patescibacteria group bacterium]